MPRNVEIKARLKDLDKALKIASDLCKSDGSVLNQEDVFFKVPNGRLKLRKFEDGTTSQLISYSRPNTEGPKISDYSICNIENHQQLLQVLKSSLGCAGVVRKKRYLFIYGQTRIHIDAVENLGEFLELEVVLRDDQGLDEGKKIADDLLDKLGVTNADLVTGAYVDHL